jgi:hypothetical protein
MAIVRFITSGAKQIAKTSKTGRRHASKRLAKKKAGTEKGSGFHGSPAEKNRRGANRKDKKQMDRAERKGYTREHTRRYRIKSAG